MHCVLAAAVFPQQLHASLPLNTVPQSAPPRTLCPTKNLLGRQYFNNEAFVAHTNFCSPLILVQKGDNLVLLFNYHYTGTACFIVFRQDFMYSLCMAVCKVAIQALLEPTSPLQMAYQSHWQDPSQNQRAVPNQSQRAAPSWNPLAAPNHSQRAAASQPIGSQAGNLGQRRMSPGCLPCCSAGLQW